MLTNASVHQPATQSTKTKLHVDGITLAILGGNAKFKTSSVQLAHAFTNDHKFTVDGTMPVHLVGYVRGSPPIIDPTEHNKQKTVEAQTRTKIASNQPTESYEPRSIASKSSAIDSKALMGIAHESPSQSAEDGSDFDKNVVDDYDDDEVDSDSNDFVHTKDKEIDKLDIDDDESEDDETEEDGRMKLAPPAIEKILRGESKRDSAGAARVDPKERVHSKVKVVSAPEKRQQAAPAAPPPAKRQAKEPEYRRVQNGLEVLDIRIGKGAVASNGCTAKVLYVGKLINGRRFDEGEIPFRLGKGEVIRGWDLGVSGMKVGGQRKLRIAPNLAYGKRGAPPTIPPNATLLFDVELRDVRFGRR